MSDVLDADSAPVADNSATTPATPAAPTTAPAAAPAAALAAPATLATGKETPAPPVPQTWPEDWRERMAASTGGSDAKLVAKELARLKRFTDPTAIWASERDLEAKFSQGGLTKIPGPKATPEEKAAFFKAIGVPEKPTEYFDKIKLSNNRVLGDNDKPVLEYFAGRLHPLGTTPAQISALTDAWFDYQTQVTADREAADDAYMAQQEAEISKSWGGAKARNINAIGALFDGTPGGAEIKDILLNGRDAEGNKLGNNVAVLNFLANMGLDHFPQGSVVTATGASASDRLTEIRNIRKTDPDKYNADKKMQAEEVELIDAELRANRRGQRAA